MEAPHVALDWRRSPAGARFPLSHPPTRLTPEGRVPFSGGGTENEGMYVNLTCEARQRQPESEPSPPEPETRLSQSVETWGMLVTQHKPGCPDCCRSRGQGSPLSTSTPCLVEAPINFCILAVSFHLCPTSPPTTTSFPVLGEHFPRTRAALPPLRPSSSVSAQ